MKHKLVQQHKYFPIKDGIIERTHRYCPRCGNSILAQHKDRLSCGKCTYSEFKSR